MPLDFIIPNDTTTWPEEAVGLKLGHRVQSIQQEADILEILVIYRLKYGHMRIPAHSFIVPYNDSSWPAKMWGVDIGAQLADIRDNDRDRDRDKDSGRRKRRRRQRESIQMLQQSVDTMNEATNT
eukprot:gene40906-54165_t